MTEGATLTLPLTTAAWLTLGGSNPVQYQPPFAEYGTESFVLVALDCSAQSPPPREEINGRSLLRHPQQSIKYAVLSLFSEALREREV